MGAATAYDRLSHTVGDAIGIPNIFRTNRFASPLGEVAKLCFDTGVLSMFKLCKNFLSLAVLDSSEGREPNVLPKFIVKNYGRRCIP